MKKITALLIALLVALSFVADTQAKRTAQRQRTQPTERTSRSTSTSVSTSRSSGGQDRPGSVRQSMTYSGPGGLKITNHTWVDVDIYWTKDDRVKVEVCGDQDLLDYIGVSLSDGHLQIMNVGGENYQATYAKKRQKGQVRVYCNYLNAIRLFGSGNINADRVDCTSLQLATYGAGDIVLGTLDSTSLRIITQGAGDVRIGTADTTAVYVLVQGAGDVRIGSADCTDRKSVV